jgi:hypothetical protein
MLSLEIGLAKFRFDSRQLSLKDRDEKIATPASRFQKTGVDSLGFTLDEIQHFFDEPTRREHLAVVCNSSF